MKVVSYKILESNKSEFEGSFEFAVRVQKWIESGWQPLGGISTTSYLGRSTYSQAVVKYAAK